MDKAPNALTNPTYRIEQSFSDVDDLSDRTRDWNLDFRQLERGAFCGNIFQFAASGVQVAEARFRKSLHQTGMPPIGLRTIAVPANPDTRFTWRGREIDGNSLMLFPTGGELDSVTSDDFHVYTCSFPDELLDSAARVLQFGSVDRICGSDEVLRCDSSDMERLRCCLSDICRLANSGDQAFFSVGLDDRLRIQLPALLLSTIRNGSNQGIRVTTRRRERALERSVNLIQNRLRGPLPVAEVAKASGVSKRTLEYAFAERFGISPKEYIMMMRLRAVRSELRGASPDKSTIARIAANWGFWHMGQFASDYKRQFSELPSHTLNRSPVIGIPLSGKTIFETTRSSSR